MTALFEIGELNIAPGAQHRLERNHQEAQAFLDRHALGDFGEIEPDVAHANHLAIDQRQQVYSAYLLADRKSVLWIVTDLSETPAQTVVCLPSEYDGI
jgi:hypothetical protein